MRKNYLIYVSGKDDTGKSMLIPVVVEASGADIQRKKHVEVATDQAKQRGLAVVNDVFFADTVHEAVEAGIELEGDTQSVCAELHNELRKGGRLQPPPDVNEAMWRIADAFLQFQDAIPERSKVQLLKSIGSNQPSWDRAVYGVYRLDDNGKATVSKLQVDDLGELRHLKKAGINMELMLRILAKMGVLEPVLRMIERRVDRLKTAKAKMGLAQKTGEAVEIPSKAKISTKRSDNERRNPF